MENSAERPATGHTNSGHVLGIPRPPSVGGISSRVTDEDGERTSSYTSPPATIQSRPSVSRRGPPPTRNSVSGPSQVTSRPGSSGSRLSRTHIPSLTAQAFFRPMSSQRLQAHRGTRPMTKGTVSSTDDWPENGSQNRRSLISNSTIPQGSVPPTEMEAPPSRGTEFTDPIIPDRNTSNASPTGNTTVRSLGESVRLLRDRDQNHKPQRLNLGANYTGYSGQDAPPKSPLSFLSIQNRAPGYNNESRTHQGHEHLSSAGSSPGPLDVKKPPLPKANPGKNFEYFLGNTIFCGGGRFQNSRDKPVNIATGLMVVVPAALFFAFSYVTDLI
jgi:palmitoyltransferase ZDHHC9/14/18